MQSTLTVTLTCEIQERNPEVYEREEQNYTDALATRIMVFLDSLVAEEAMKRMNGQTRFDTDISYETI